MNKLQIDISFNYNDSIKIISDISYNLDNYINKFFQLESINFEICNKKLFRDIELKVPIKLILNNIIKEKILNIKTNCIEKIYKDSSGNDISKNNLFLGFDERPYFNNGNIGDKLENFMNKIPDDIMNNHDNLFELDINGEDLPEDINEWKQNNFTFKPFQIIKLGEKYLYCWLNNFGINIRSKINFKYNFLFFFGNKLNLRKIDLFKMITMINLRKNIEIKKGDILKKINKNIL